LSSSNTPKPPPEGVSSVPRNSSAPPPPLPVAHQPVRPLPPKFPSASATPVAAPPQFVLPPELDARATVPDTDLVRLAPGSDFPDDVEGVPTRVKSQQTIHTIRQLVDTVSVPRLVLTVEREGGIIAQRTITHDGDLCRIGTHSSNDLVVRDPAVSRFHCRLVREEGTWRIRDTGSLNGTKLDNVRMRDADLPSEGGTLAMGDSLIRVRPAEAHQQSAIPLIPSFGQIAGISLPMRKLFALLEKVAQSEINVLIEGESGTGKELVAQELVQHSARADKPFVVVDCGAISPNLVESELFGHARGAFTGADRERIGAFESAEGGTVFLDEIGELPLELQPKLLRALEAREIRRVGETKPRKINVRVVSATNRDLEREVNKGRFREDLYFRLAVLTVHVPALRERLDDLLILIRVFLQQLGCPQSEKLFPTNVLSELARHDWPGNVRELRNYVERCLVLETAIPTSKRHSGAPSAGGAVGTGGGGEGRLPFKIAKDSAIDAFERAYLATLLEEAAGNMSKAARIAGMDRMYLHRLVQKHGLRGQGSQAPPGLGL
jgi:DNA-binding NtrC family response regulator